MRRPRRRSDQTIQNQNDNRHDCIRLPHRDIPTLRIKTTGRQLGCVASNTGSNADHSKSYCLCSEPVDSKALRLVPASSLSALKGHECVSAPRALVYEQN